MGNLCSISIATEDTLAHCWDCTSRHANYMVLLDDNLDDLKGEVEELRKLRNDVIRRVKLEEEQQMTRLDQVESWLSRVETEISEIEELIRNSPSQVQEFYHGGCCSWNPLWVYKFGKKVTKKLKQVAYLMKKGEFESVAERLPSAFAKERPIGPTVGLEKSFDKVWGWLMEEDIGVIGICGMGGLGKTTLLSQLNNMFLGLPNGFDIVIWVTVSKDLELEKIQEEIGGRIGLLDGLWKNKSIEEKALDIYQTLRCKKFVLMLDDVWRRVKLLEIGVPIPDERNGSKVVFTTRSKEVCGHMEAQRIFKMTCLMWNDAWSLFEKKVGSALYAHPDIPSLARQVLQECCGLPLVVITVGRAMACKRTPQEWHHAVEVLSKCASVFSGLGDEVFPLLKFSYDNLPSEMVRSCFLYCILFSGRISKANLIDYWIGEGLVDGGSDICGLQNQGHYIIATLVHACLLDDKGDFVVMHDVIRDMALWIAGVCERQEVLLKAGARLREAPDSQKWEGVKWISLMANDIESLSAAPTCTALQTLILSHNCLKSITDDFFRCMPTLTTLDLSYNKNLEVLPIGISKLVSLQHLNLSMTGIKQLPLELKNLVKMRSLNLDHTSALVNIPKQLIASFELLRVLRMVNSGSQYHMMEGGLLSSDGEDLVAELESLKLLDLLYITVRGYNALRRLLSSHKLHGSIQHLSLQLLGEPESLDFSLLRELKNLEMLSVRNCINLEILEMQMECEGTRMLQPSRNCWNVKIMDSICFSSLKEVYVDNCPRLRHLTWVILARNLTVLSVSLCFEMEEIFSCEELNKLAEVKQHLVPFERLELLYLSHLPRLRKIYHTTRALSCPCLQKVIVHNCPKLKKLPIKPSAHMEHRPILDGNWIGRQQWEEITGSSPL